MFSNRWFGLSPKPVVRMQYMTPWTKRLLCLMGLLLFGFACYIGGTLHQFEQRIITQQLELPQDTTDTLEPSGTDYDEHSFIFPTITPVNLPDEYQRYVVFRPHTWNPGSSEKFADELECLAQNIYFEARSESHRGKIAVGLVTINRVKSDRFPNTICDVVWQKRRNQNQQWVAQFSWTWDGKADTPRNQEAWEESKILAGAMIAEGTLDNFADFTRGSTHYHADYVSPWWGEKLQAAGYSVQQIDTHLFYSNL